jgi:hypothetical protein
MTNHRTLRGGPQACERHAKLGLFEPCCDDCYKAEAAREAPADAPPATPTPGLDRACLNCEGHGVVRHYLNRAGEFDKSHCPICDGTGKEAQALRAQLKAAQEAPK